MSAALEEVRVRTLGKSGGLTEQLKELGKLAPSRAQGSGRALQSRARRDPGVRSRRSAPSSSRPRVAAKLATERIDVTLPGRGERAAGCIRSPRARLRIEQLFRQAGFDVADGPEIEDDFHNFEALNIPPTIRRARCTTPSTSPTGRLLRTHTSPVQIRAMLRGQAADRA